MVNSGGQEPERVVARLRPHARALFWPSLVLLAVCGAAGYFGGFFDVAWQNLLVLAGGALLVVLLFLLPLAAWLSRRYTITSRRLIMRGGLFVRHRQELLHSRGYDVTVRRSWVQGMFRTGDLVVDTGNDRRVVLRDVPRASLVQSALLDLVERNQITASRGASALPDETVAWGRR